MRVSASMNEEPTKTPTEVDGLGDCGCCCCSGDGDDLADDASSLLDAVVILSSCRNVVVSKTCRQDK